jgi:hypothetical protein
VLENVQELHHAGNAEVTRPAVSQSNPCFRSRHASTHRNCSSQRTVASDASRDYTTTALMNRKAHHRMLQAASDHQRSMPAA